MGIARTLRIVGYLLLIVVAIPTLIDRHTEWDGELLAWAAAYIVFVFAFHVASAAPEGDRRRRMGGLLLMTPAMLAMAWLQPCHFASLSLVIVAAQAALVLRPVGTVALILFQSILLMFVIVCTHGKGLDLRESLSTVIAFGAGEAFAAVAVYAARREAEARNDLARTNAELRATRSLLEETSRVNERTRIARELHDVLGHDLTALGLQLEVATHVSTERAATHVAKAKDVSARLLHNVRDVVSAMRASPGPDLRTALHALVEDVPGLQVHLAMPDALCIDDGARGHCILRCVQEIVTNTMRHAGARNLWVRITQGDDGDITVDARDDGTCPGGVVRAGCGLSGMRARLEELGGWLRVAAEPSREVVVSAWLPALSGLKENAS
ncbi:histidine kinase [Pendulispora rubella]|uniref:Histidine kinase n=1 Tax=Pendulispora rubella TaxID=2741070 RepID=A0ABZ2KTE0_9BACT